MNKKDKNMKQDRERMIVAQSSLKFTLDWSTSCGKCLTLKEVLGITNVIIDYVENGYSKELGERADKIQEHLDYKK